MRCELPSDLPKLGHRPYIQGGSIFNGILDACDRSFGPTWLQDAVISSFKLERESVANGKFVLSDVKMASVEPNATFVARSPSKRIFVDYFDEGRPVRQEPYDEESYYRVVQLGSKLEGSFTFPAGRPREDFMRAVVGANKRLHQETTRFAAPLTRIQFLYLTGLDANCIVRSSQEYEVRIHNVSAQERGAEVWTMNHVNVRARNFSAQLRICYRAARQTS